MLPARTLLSKLINSLSFCLTTLVNVENLNKCLNYKPNKCFNHSDQKITKIYVFLWLEVVVEKKSARVRTERPANAFPGIIINISLNVESTTVQKSLDIRWSIIKNLISLDLSFKSNNFVLGLIPRTEWMVVFQGPLNEIAMFLI